MTGVHTAESGIGSIPLLGCGIVGGTGGACFRSFEHLVLVGEEGMARVATLIVCTVSCGRAVVVATSTDTARVVWRRLDECIASVIITSSLLSSRREKFLRQLDKSGECVFPPPSELSRRCERMRCYQALRRHPHYCLVGRGLGVEATATTADKGCGWSLNEYVGTVAVQATALLFSANCLRARLG